MVLVELEGIHMGCRGPWLKPVAGRQQVEMQEPGTKVSALVSRGSKPQTSRLAGGR
jgi:hypothetical protein